MNKLSYIGLLAAMSMPLFAQQPQIPTLQVCNLTGGMVVSGSGFVDLISRKDATHSGIFDVTVKVTCDSNGFPTGSLTLFNISMTDSAVQGTINATTFDQLTSTGRATPTAYMSGRCEASSATGAAPTPCHYWIMFAHNNTEPSVGEAPDIVSFLVFNKSGQRIAYGTGPLAQGSIAVSPTSY